MKTVIAFVILVCSLFLNVERASAQSPIDLVRSIKASVVAAGINPDLPGDECRRFEITGRVAWSLRSQGYGLIAKFPGQNQCRGYAVDAIMKRDGTVVDILGGGPEGPNTPQWLESQTNAALFRDPIDLGPLGGVVNPPPVSGGEAAPAVLLDVQAKVTDSQAKLRDLQAQVDEARKQLAALQVTADAVKTDTEAIRNDTNGLGDVMKWLAKYALPAVGALLAGRALGQ